MNNDKLPAIRDLYHRDNGGLPVVTLDDLAGRVTTIKVDRELIVGDDYAVYKLTKEDIDNYCKRAVEWVDFIESRTGIIITIPTELIAYKEANLASLISMLKDHASNNGVAVIQCITNGNDKLRVSDTLINNVHSVLNKGADKCSIVRDVVHIRRSNASRRRNCFKLSCQ